jgi:hypothetical protein
MDRTVFDPLRKKSVALTPEEEVRQFFIGWLSRERNWPLALMASEYGIKFNGRSYRCDIVAFNRQLQPQIIVECKAPEVVLGKGVLEQIAAYNLVLKVPVLVITNGNSTYVCSYSNKTGKYEFVEDIPFYLP